MTMKRFTTFVSTTLFSLLVFAQNMNVAPTNSPDYRPLMIQGQIASIRIVPGDKSMKLFVLGKKTLEAKPTSDLRPEILKVTAFSGNNQEELRLTPEGDYYTVTKPKLQNPYSLRIETRLQEQMEKLEVKIPNKKP